MKAVYYEHHGGPDVLQFGDLPIPEIGPDEVLVRVVATSVNPIDRRLRNGELQEYITRTFPVVPGWDLAGEIVEIGQRVSGWNVGDKVLGLAFTWSIQHGAYAEYIPVKADSIARKPDQFSYAQAASIPLVSLTAWQAVYEFGRVQEGDSVFIQAGAGGVGSVAIPMAKYLGAKVYTTTSRNVAFLQELGADVVINYREQNYEEVIRDLEPDGVNMVLESLSGEDASRAAIRLAKANGAVAYMNNEPPQMPEIAERNIRAEFLHHRPDGEMLEHLTGLYETGVLTLPEIEVLPLSAAREAHVRSELGHTRGKIVLAVQELA